MTISVVQVVEAAAYGTGRHVEQLCRGLAAEDFAVTLIASTRRQPDFRRTMTELEAVGVCCLELDMRRSVSPCRDFRTLMKLEKLLREIRPDVVHGHGSKGGFLARAAAHAIGLPNTVYTPHCFAFAGPVGAFRTRFYRAMERRAGRWTARLIAVSSHEARLAADAKILPPERISLIPNGLEDDAPVSPTPSPDLRTALGLDPSDVVIGFVGRLWRQKGLDLLIMSLPEVLKRRPAARLLLLGEGPERKALEKLARTVDVADRVVFVGQRPDVRTCLQLMDVFVLPSRWESAPYALLEAMASARPIVATRVGGMPEMLDDGRCGALVEPEDPDALARAILDVLQKPDDGARKAQAARDRVRTHYRLRESVSRTAQLYRELTSENA